jgi:alpha-N-arabinofuranosidase
MRIVSCRFILGVAAGLALTSVVRAAEYAVTVDCAAEKGVVSPELFGVNAIYCNEPDARWQSGAHNVPALLAQAGIKLIRYPGGTVTTYYHWPEPTGQGWSDTWDPDFNPAKNKPASATMSLDEYLDVVKTAGITPLVGVNMGSGIRHHRVEEGIAEAEGLVKHCIARGAHVRYYYLDNEPYARDANFTYQPEEYADQINRYAPALKAIDPSIRIIANLHPGVTKVAYTRTVVKRAGANIDIVDLHNYWRHGSASFAGWIEEPHMLHQHERPYVEERAAYRKIFAEEGFPNIELAVLEWNVGPPGAGKTAPTPAESALLAAEQFTQYIQSGLKMACFWPLHWEVGDQTRALLSSAHGYTPNKVHGMFCQFAGLGGQMQVTSAVASGASPDRLTHLAVKAADGSALWIFLINKNQTAPAAVVDLDVTSFGAFESVAATGFDSSDATAGPLQVHSIPTARQAQHVSLSVGRNAFGKVTLSKSKVASP